jgi:hypothetical protein
LASDWGMTAISRGRDERPFQGRTSSLGILSQACGLGYKRRPFRPQKNDNAVLNMAGQRHG